MVHPSTLCAASDPAGSQVPACYTVQYDVVRLVWSRSCWSRRCLQSVFLSTRSKSSWRKSWVHKLSLFLRKTIFAGSLMFSFTLFSMQTPSKRQRSKVHQHRWSPVEAFTRANARDRAGQTALHAACLAKGSMRGFSIRWYRLWHEEFNILWQSMNYWIWEYGIWLKWFKYQLLSILAIYMLEYYIALYSYIYIHIH